jgi:5-hydroxyisourate hydrolase
MSKQPGISTHILDTALGKPAAGVPVILDRADGQHWLTCASTSTDHDGRCSYLIPADRVVAGKYRLTFQIAPYFAALHQTTLYPEIVITFVVAADGASYHIPLLLNPFGYTTYRGS